MPAVEELLGIARQAVEHAADPSLPATWEAVAEPLDTASERLWRAWSVAGHLNAVVNTPELREAYNAALPLVTEFSTWVGLHEGLYKQYQRLAAAPDFAAWTPVRRRIVEMALRDFRLSGVELQGADRERYAAISDREAQASQKFSENVLDAIDAWSLFVEDEARLAGIPADVLAAARAAAEEDGKPGWKLTLKMPCYLPVMQYARDRDLREALYRGYGTVASEQGDAQFDNSPLIEELLSLRAEEAGLLGLGTFAGLRLQTRMARDAREVTEFLRDLAARASPTRSATRPSCAPMPTPSWAWPNCSPGTCPMPPSACANRATPTRKTRSSSTSPSRACWPACTRSSRPCSTCAWWKRRYRPGTPTCAACAWKAPRAR